MKKSPEIISGRMTFGKTRALINTEHKNPYLFLVNIVVKVQLQFLLGFFLKIQKTWTMWTNPNMEFGFIFKKRITICYKV